MKFGRPSKYASIHGVGFSVWCHTFTTAAVTSFCTEKCCHLVSEHIAPDRRLCSSVDSSWCCLTVKEKIIVHGKLSLSFCCVSISIHGCWLFALLVGFFVCYFSANLLVSVSISFIEHIVNKTLNTSLWPARWICDAVRGWSKVVLIGDFVANPLQIFWRLPDVDLAIILSMLKCPRKEGVCLRVGRKTGWKTKGG